MSKPFHLELAPAFCNDTIHICVRQKQSVSSISFLFLLPQVFNRVCFCLLADKSLELNTSDWSLAEVVRVATLSATLFRFKTNNNSNLLNVYLVVQV